MTAPFNRDEQIELIQTMDERVAMRERAWAASAVVRHVLLKTQDERRRETEYEHATLQLACG